MYAPRGKRQFANNQTASDVDLIVFGHDIDGMGGLSGMGSGQIKKKDNRLFRSDADMAIFGRDQDGSNQYESYSRR